MSGVKVPNEKFLFSARSFYKATKWLHEQKLEGVPIIVNGVLALELYLKSLDASVVVEGELNSADGVSFRTIPNNPTHGLAKLFDSLSPNTQDQLASAFGKIPVHSYEHGRDVDLDFRQCLELYEGAFVAWRYVFERKNVRPINITVLLEILRFLDHTIPSIKE